MTALAAAKNRDRAGREAGDSPTPIPIKANVKIYQGSLVVNDAGVGAVARTATGLVALGVSAQTYDNTGGAAGAMTVDCHKGTFKFTNSAAGDAIVAADAGKTVYIVDDDTVAKTDGTGTRSAAGTMQFIDTDGGVFVKVGS